MGRIFEVCCNKCFVTSQSICKRENTLLNDNREMYNSKGKYAWMEMLDIPTTQQ